MPRRDVVGFKHHGKTQGAECLSINNILTGRVLFDFAKWLQVPEVPNTYCVAMVILVIAFYLYIWLAIPIP